MEGEETHGGRRPRERSPRPAKNDPRGARDPDRKERVPTKPRGHHGGRPAWRSPGLSLEGQKPMRAVGGESRLDSRRERRPEAGRRFREDAPAQRVGGSVDNGMRAGLRKRRPIGRMSTL